MRVGVTTRWRFWLAVWRVDRRRNFWSWVVGLAGVTDFAWRLDGEFYGMEIKDRIVRFDRVPASSLKASPRNWRDHPEAQREALRAVLGDVGVADAALVRELPDGSLELIDGHLRTEELGDGLIPILVLDVDEVEANKILLTHDPLAAMAKTDATKLDSLLRDISSNTSELDSLLARIAETEGIKPPNFKAADPASQGRLDQPKTVSCPNCDYVFTP